ncbi:uncharacterized protein TNCT_189121 [Trichonephila clavata]|uniref:Uncharacterized protein n=1 Tax=Trichonephila clavata TaxID=2740835 RepID=A0A8X6I7B8_TRICU|nr:uncharacterized protein TNCT_189121 [Trichonephila clavata]
MPKRKYSFNVSLQAKYPFIKQINTPPNVRCEKCRTEFTVSHSGAGDIEHHLKSEKHKNADRAATLSSSMLNFFNKLDASTSKDLDISVAEDVWAYHMTQENHSFRCNDCVSKLIQLCFELQFTCAGTKSEAIVIYRVSQKCIHILAADRLESIREDFEQKSFISARWALPHYIMMLDPFLTGFANRWIGRKVCRIKYQLFSCSMRAAIELMYDIPNCPSCVLFHRFRCQRVWREWASV